MLLAPLPGREKRPTPIEAEAEGESFMALMAQAGQRPGISSGTPG